MSKADDAHSPSWWIGYCWWRVRCHVAYLPMRLREWLLKRIPPKLALRVFIQVYGIDGECGPELERICRAWQRKYGFYGETF